MLRGMIAVVLAAFSAQAAAQPSCWPDASLKGIVAADDGPVQVGQIAVRVSSVGMVWGYACRKADGGLVHVIYGGPWSSWAPDWLHIAVTALKGTDDDRVALWKKYATTGQLDERLRADADVVKARLPVDAPPPPPPPAGSLVVAPTSICASADRDASGRCVRRQTYVWADGARGAVAPEKVGIGEPCDASVGAAGFHGVLGRTDRVAPCVRP